MAQMRRDRNKHLSASLIEAFANSLAKRIDMDTENNWEDWEEGAGSWRSKNRKE
jgi:hypothetical protein